MLVWMCGFDRNSCIVCREQHGTIVDGPHECLSPLGCRCLEISVDEKHNGVWGIISNGIWEKGQPAAPSYNHTREDSALTPCEICKVCPESAVENPSHYGGAHDPYEHVKVAEAKGWDSDAFIYNTTKYLWRFGKKAGASILQDLKKARWYLDRKIKNLEKEESHGDHQQS